jgi:MFS transporter, ACS family, pantothenate transporter
MTMGFCFQIWVPLLTFPAVEAPRWHKGYPAAVAFETAMWSFLVVGYWYMKRYKLRNPDLEMRLRAEENEKIAGIETSSQGGSIEEIGRKAETKTSPKIEVKS